MNNAYVIEIDDQTVGLIVRQGDGTERQRYRFYASAASLRAIEGKFFGSPNKAYRAALTVYRGGTHTMSHWPRRRGDAIQPAAEAAAQTPGSSAGVFF
jgi:hypothetical protein